MAIRKDKMAGLIGTTIVHIVILLVLLFVFVHRPEAQAEGGVPVMMGNADAASGDADPMMLTQVDVMEKSMPQTETMTSSEPESELPSEPKADNLITQEEEKTVKMVAAKNVKNKTKIKAKENIERKHSKKPAVEKKTEIDKTAEEHQATVEKVAATASQSVAGAFSKGTKMGSRGTGEHGEGIEGSPTGNSNTGKSTGVGGYGTFDLNGRSIGAGGLPMPTYNVQDEGRVVVTITVNPAGQVIGTTINKRTNTVNARLREAAVNAAKKARFNSIDGVNNQMGTITYYFKLK